MIAVPYYDKMVKYKCSSEYKFQFNWNLPIESKYKGIDFILQEGTCLLYNGLIVYFIGNFQMILISKNQIFGIFQCIAMNDYGTQYINLYINVL